MSNESDAKARARMAFESMREGRQKAGFTDYTQREAVWSVDVTCPVTGKRYMGSFQSKMPSLGERDRVNLVAASFANGVPWVSIPPQTQGRFLMYGEFAVLLDERPDWFADPSSFMTEDVPAAVYKHIAEHFKEYFRSGLCEDGGRAEDGRPGQPAAASEG